MSDEPITTAAQMREAAALVTEKHDGKPCSPVFLESWTHEQREAYDAGQTDATFSVAFAIRAIPIAPPAPDPRVAALVEAGDKLSLAAQTSCGTAGRDDNLVAAIEAWTAARAALGETGDG